MNYLADFFVIAHVFHCRHVGRSLCEDPFFFNTCKETKPPWLLSKAALFALIKIVFLCVNTVPIKAPVCLSMKCCMIWY